MILMLVEKIVAILLWTLIVLLLAIYTGAYIRNFMVFKSRV